MATKKVRQSKKKIKKEVDYPQEWEKFFVETQKDEFKSLVRKYKETNSKEDKMNIMEEMLFCYGGEILKKQKLDYHNSWKIDFIDKYIERFLENGVYSENENHFRKVISAKLMFSHLDMFFNEMERLKKNNSVSKKL